MSDQITQINIDDNETFIKRCKFLSRYLFENFLSYFKLNKVYNNTHLTLTNNTDE